VDKNDLGEVDGATSDVHGRGHINVVYNILPQGRWRPYVGVGVNWTIFYNDDTSGTRSARMGRGCGQVELRSIVQGGSTTGAARDVRCDAGA
jgi:outer membrane protein W